METDLLQVPAATAESELLAVFTADNSTSKGKDARPEIALLSNDEALKNAVGAVLSTGEFKGTPTKPCCFTLQPE